jgi:hypothetical protein
MTGIGVLANIGSFDLLCDHAKLTKEIHRCLKVVVFDTYVPQMSKWTINLQVKRKKE